MEISLFLTLTSALTIQNYLSETIAYTEVIELRKNCIGIGENEKLIKGDLFKLDWCEELDSTLPTLMIVSGMFQYFHEKEILEFIKNAKDIFENAELIFDATNKFGIRYSNIYVKRTGNKSALMHFYIENTKEFAKKSRMSINRM